MRLSIFTLVALALFTSGCGDDSVAPVNCTPVPTTYEVKSTTNWFVTSPDVNLSQFTSVKLTVTFTSDVDNDMIFNSSPQFQLWSDPDAYDFVLEGDVTINREPSGTVSPGSSFSYDLTVDLTSIPADQGHIAIRPKENNLYGTLGPAKISVFLSEVTFTQ